MADGEISRIDGAAQARPDVGDGAEVVFMRMGYKHCVNAVAIAFQPGRISQPQFHAGKVVIQKIIAGIDHDYPAVGYVGIHVHADFFGTAQCDKIKTFLS